MQREISLFKKIAHVEVWSSKKASSFFNFICTHMNDVFFTRTFALSCISQCIVRSEYLSTILRVKRTFELHARRNYCKFFYWNFFLYFIFQISRHIKALKLEVTWLGRKWKKFFSNFLRHWICVRKSFRLVGEKIAFGKWLNTFMP